MKRVIYALLLGFLFSPAFSQEYFKTLTEKYSDKEGFSATFITRDMFNMYLKKKQVDEKSTVSETLKNLENILIVSQTGFGKEKDEAGIADLQKEIVNRYKNDAAYTLFKTQKTMGDDLKVYLKKVNEKITSLSVISSTSFSLNLVELNGLIDMESLSDLGRELNLKGLESLYRLSPPDIFYGRAFGEYYGQRGSTGFQYLPGNEWNKQLEEQLKQLEKTKELSAEQRKKIEEQAKLMAEKQAQMAEKYREMAEKYNRSPIFLSSPGDTNVIYYLNGKKVSAAEIKKIDPDDIKTVDVNKSDEKGKKNIIRIVTK